jgi:hypothetical protein
MEIRFWIDPETLRPHIHNHGVTEDEIRQLLKGRGEDLRGRRGTRIRLGQTAAGRHLQVVYSLDKKRKSLLVITAYDLKGKALKAFRRQKRRRGR